MHPERSDRGGKHGVGMSGIVRGAGSVLRMPGRGLVTGPDDGE